MNLMDLKKLAGITPQRSNDFHQINPSYTGSQLAKIQKENNIQPGTPEWFRLWFARPYLTGESPIDYTLNENDIVTELFDQPYPISQSVRTAQRRLYHFDGREDMFYTVQALSNIDPVSKEKTLVLGFVAKDRKTGSVTIKRTDRKDAIKVFATLNDIMSKELATQKPDQFEFSADAQDPSRVSLYRRLMSRALSSYPDYKLSGDRAGVNVDGQPEHIFTAKRVTKSNEV